MNYAEEMLARQVMLWRYICASLPMEKEDETQAASQKRLAFEEELCAVQGEQSGSEAGESGRLREDAPLDEAVRRAVLFTVDELRRGMDGRALSAAESTGSMTGYGGEAALRGGAFRAVDAQEADALMHALAEESVRRSGRRLSGHAEAAVHGAHTAAFGEAAADMGAVYAHSLQGEAANLYGALPASARETYAWNASAQEVSRRFERDSRRYDAAFTRYE